MPAQTDTIDVVAVQHVIDRTAKLATLNDAERVHAYRTLTRRGLTTWQIAKRLGCSAATARHIAELAENTPDTPTPRRRPVVDTPTATPPCRRNPDMWTDDEDRYGEAIHQCLRHCPMLAFCQQLDGVPDTVMAGVLWEGRSRGGRPHHHHAQPVEVICGDCAVPLNSGERPCPICTGPMSGKAKYCSPQCRKVGDMIRKRANEKVRWQRTLASREQVSA